MSFSQLFRKTKSNKQYDEQTVRSTLLELVFFIVFLAVVSISKYQNVKSLTVPTN